MNRLWNDACAGTGERCFSLGRGKLENATFP